jgi:hypothetical protein
MRSNPRAGTHPAIVLLRLSLLKLIEKGASDEAQERFIRSELLRLVAAAEADPPMEFGGKHKLQASLN